MTDEDVAEELRKLRQEVALLNRRLAEQGLGEQSGAEPSADAPATDEAGGSTTGAQRDRSTDPRRPDAESGPSAPDADASDSGAVGSDAGASSGRADAGQEDAPVRSDDATAGTEERDVRSGDAGAGGAPRDGSAGAESSAGQTPPDAARADAASGGSASADERGSVGAGWTREPDPGWSEGSGGDPSGESGDSSRGPGGPSGGPGDPGDGRDWERSVGTKWLGVVGALALVIGAVFFARVAIERWYFPPIARVAAGTLGGLGLLGVGRYAGRRRGDLERWGQIASGAGLAVAYFSVYAAHGIDAYQESIGAPPLVVVLALTALVAGGVALAVREGEPLFAGEAILLGYVTAIVGLDAATPLVTPVYVVLLTAGLIATAVAREWEYYVALGVLPAYVSLLFWTGQTGAHAAIEVSTVGAVYLLYAGGGYALDRQPRDDDAFRIQRVATTLANGVVAAIALEATVRDLPVGVDLAGAGTGAVATSLVGLYVLTATREARRDVPAGVLGVVLAVPAVAMAFGTFGTTIGLLAVLCGAVAVAHAVDGIAVRATAHVVALVTLAQVLLYAAMDLPSLDPGDPVAALTSRAVALGAAAAVFYGLAWWWYRTEPDHLPRVERELSLAAPYAWIGTGLAVLLFGAELPGAWITLAWATLGLALVGVGLRRAVRTIRMQGIAVLLLATVKVFVLDTADLDLLARTASFLVLGAILLVTSYAYARWQGDDPLAAVTDD